MKLSVAYLLTFYLFVEAIIDAMLDITEYENLIEALLQKL